MNEIIYAPATAEGLAALSVIRISGKGSDKILKKLTNIELPKPRVMSVRTFYSNKNKTNIIDRCMVVWMPGPKSYTGQDREEIYCHGSRAVVSAFLECLESFNNLRLEKEGEFTKTVLLNGKINLIEAEAINDLIISNTEEQRKLALAQINGNLTKPLKKWKELLLYCMARLESNIDFSDEEDIPSEISIEK